MRCIDIYRWEGGETRIVCAGCVQLGEPMIRRAPIIKAFTLADGSPVVYPAAKDTVTMTVELECTRVQAAGIETLVAGAHFVLTGLRFGALTPAVQTRESYPASFGYDCIITGAAEIGERYAGTDIYSVTLPLQISVDAQTKAPAEIPVDWINIEYLTLNGVLDRVYQNPLYVYQPRAWSHSTVSTGLFVRSAAYFTRAETLAFSYAEQGGGSAAQLWLGNAMLQENIAPGDIVNVTLSPGANVLTLYHWDPEGIKRPMDLRLTVYRQYVR